MLSKHSMPGVFCNPLPLPDLPRGIHCDLPENKETWFYGKNSW